MEQKINITLKKIIEITKGSFAGSAESLESKISSITIDSRSEKQSDLYIAIIGKSGIGKSVLLKHIIGLNI